MVGLGLGLGVATRECGFCLQDKAARRDNAREDRGVPSVSLSLSLSTERNLGATIPATHALVHHRS